MTGDLGQRVASLETLARSSTDAHTRLSDKMDTLLQLTAKISNTQDNIAVNVGEMNKSINEHDDRIRSLENTRLSNEASATLLRRIAYVGWTLAVFVAGLFGIHFYNTPPTPPTH